jgi:hypothetical protein
VVYAYKIPRLNLNNSREDSNRAKQEDSRALGRELRIVTSLSKVLRCPATYRKFLIKIPQLRR